MLFMLGHSFFCKLYVLKGVHNKVCVFFYLYLYIYRWLVTSLWESATLIFLHSQVVVIVFDLIFKHLIAFSSEKLFNLDKFSCFAGNGCIRVFCTKSETIWCL